MNKILLSVVAIVVLTIFLQACAKEGSPVPVKNNLDEFRVKLLFEVDGIKVYRFMDCGNWHYVASRGLTTSQISSGKSSRPEEIQTIQLEKE